MALDFTKPFVGFHARIGDHNAVGKLIDFIENHLAPMDFNAVIIELNPGYAYRCFPQYATGTVTYEDLQAIAAACRRCGIKPIPLIQSLSHQSDQSENSPFGTGPWPLFREHPEFLETKRLPDDAGWPDLYVYTWCPSNDGTRSSRPSAPIPSMSAWMRYSTSRPRPARAAPGRTPPPCLPAPSRSCTTIWPKKASR